MAIRLTSVVRAAGIAVILSAICVAGPTLAQQASDPAQAEISADDQAALAQLEAEAVSLMDQGRYAEADAKIEALIAIELRVYGPASPLLGNSYATRASLAEARNDFVAAEAFLRQELEIRQASDDVAATLVVQANLGANLGLQNRPTDAVSLLEIAVRDIQPPTRLERLRAVIGLNAVLTALDRKAEGEAMLADVAAALAAVESAPTAYGVRIFHDLAQHRFEAGRHEAALDPAQIACRDSGQLSGADAAIAAPACYQLAMVLDQLDRDAEAEPHLVHILAFDDQPARRAQAATLLARIRTDLGRTIENEEPLRLALAAQTGAVGANDETTALAANALGLWLSGQQRPLEAIPFLRQSRATYLAAFGLAHTNTLIVTRNLLEALAAVGDQVAAEALALETAPLLSGRNDLADEGIKMSVANTLGAKHPQIAGPLYAELIASGEARNVAADQLVGLYSQLAMFAGDRLDWLEAVAYRRRALELHARVDDPRGYAMATAYLGRALAETDDVNAAYGFLKDAWTRAQGLNLGLEDRLYLMRFLGSAALETGRLDEADTLSEQLVAEANAPQLSIGGLQNRSDLLIARGRLTEAEALLNQARTLALSEPDNGVSASVISGSLANLWKIQGRYDESERAMRANIEFLTVTYGTDSLATAIELKNLAMLLSETGRPDRAAPLLLQAGRIERERLNETSAAYLSTSVQYADVLGVMDRYQDSLDILEPAVALADTHLGATHPVSRRARERMGFALVKLGREEEAIGHFILAVQSAEAAWGVDSYEVMGPLQSLAYAQFITGDYDATLETMLRVVRLADSGGARWPRALSIVKANLGATYVALGRPAEALVHLRASTALASQGILAQPDAGGFQDPFQKLVRALYLTAEEN